ncbi:unnamed protein product [Parnassius mnemosyne]|uniref:RNase H type-1 domain-containing protein n=1 Tax=Parnassius mnemosyne TaxID=213953 RepID=A0AAV1LFT5_9NEOP
MDSEEVYCQAFADDVVLVFSGQKFPKIEEKANRTLALVHDWGVRNKLGFAAHKTNAIIITRKLKYDTPQLHMGGTNIKIVDEIKLLGLIIDKKLTFHSHVVHICRKVTNIYKHLVKTAKISWGLSSEIIRTIYVSVVEPIVLYAASVWASASQKISIQKHLNTLQRGFAQKICKAYRTVSLNSALILTGLLPLDIRLREAARLYEAKRGKPQEDILGDRKVEVKELFIEADHPAKEEEITFSTIEAAEILTKINEIRNNRGDVKLYWIKAHCGILGNERADELAKLAAETSKQAPVYDCFPLSYAKRQLRDNTINTWQERYTKAETGVVTRRFFPDVTESYKTIEKINVNNLISQILTGHGGFKAYLFRFKLAESPYCSCDNQTSQTIEHILIDCPKFQLARLECELRMGFVLQEETLNRAINNNDSRTHFFKFAISSVEKIVKENKT